jgi:sugar-specific transcriptional regulator TrmB
MIEEIGLNKQEQRVYAALLKLGTSTTGPICKEANIASSHVYYILDKLIMKGLVSFQEKNRRKLFFASPPEVAQTIFDRRLDSLEYEKEKINKQREEHLKLLKQIKPLIKPCIYFKYFENISGIKAMYKEIESQMLLNSHSELMILTHKPEDVAKVSAFYDDFHKTRESLKILYKAIFDSSLKTRAKKRKKSQIKFMNLQNDTAWGAYDDIFFIYQIASNKPYGIIIKDALIASTMAFTFESIFNSIR